MTKDQFEFWKDFAHRMARTTYKENKRPSSRWIETVVEDFFAGLEGQDELIADIVDYDESENDNDCVCDYLSEVVWDYWGGFGIREQNHKKREDRIQAAIEQWEDQWARPVRCCIRAGLDVVAESSWGVIGFNMGHLREMYPEGLPEWITRNWVDTDKNPVDITRLANDEPILL